MPGPDGKVLLEVEVRVDDDPPDEAAGWSLPAPATPAPDAPSAGAVERHRDGQAVSAEVRLEPGLLQFVVCLFGEGRVVTPERDDHRVAHWAIRRGERPSFDGLDALVLEACEHVREYVLGHREILGEPRRRDQSSPRP